PLTDLLKLPVSLPRTALGTLHGLVPVATVLLGQGTVSSLNGSIGRQRRYAAVRTTLPLVAEIGAGYGVTVNDVVLAAITAGYRELLRHRGEEIGPHGLRIVVPVSMRAEHAEYAPDNRVSAVLPYLPIDRSDAVERLRVVHARMTTQKSGGSPKAEDTVLALARRLPFAPVAWSLRLAARFPQRAVGALATDVPGPKRELTLYGRRVLELWPAAPIAMRLRTAVAVLSYHEQLVFGITGDFDSTPDIGVLASGIQREVGELADRAARSR
ncbi:MAG: DUF1298 domain-containing protein, partial [Nocardia sp.]|nr:DUF1298 domain-containing protein [Nocardia sp.]